SANVTKISGLVEVLKFGQSLEGFGSPTHRRFGKYSLLHVDVKIYWQIFRMLYSYPKLAPIRMTYSWYSVCGILITTPTLLLGARIDPHSLAQRISRCIQTI